MSEILQVGTYCLVNRDLTQSEGTSKNSHIHRATLVRVEDHLSPVIGCTGVRQVTFRRDPSETIVDLPTEALTPLSFESLRSIVIPYAIANIHIGGKRLKAFLLTQSRNRT